MTDQVEHRTHEEHGDHIHGGECGHEPVQHDDHLDYQHDGHRHAKHTNHWDEHESGEVQPALTTLPSEG